MREVRRDDRAIVNCESCRFFRERANKPTPQSYGLCRRYPKERLTLRGHWCGEFKLRTGKRL